MNKFIILFVLVHMAMTSSIPAQIITIKQKQVTLKAFMDLVTQKSKYRFIYTDDDLAHARRKDLSIENMAVEKVLSEYFKDQPLNYKIVDRNIVISPKSERMPGSTAKTSRPSAGAQAAITGQVLLQVGSGQEVADGVTITIKGTNRRFFTKADG